MSDSRIRGLASLSFFPGEIGATALNNSKIELGKEFNPPRGNYDAEFIEWFRGFTDAEGCFMIVHLRDNFWRFSFEIKLHKDDLNALEKIQEMLGIGNIYASGSSCRLIITKQQEIKKIL